MATKKKRLADRAAKKRTGRKRVAAGIAKLPELLRGRNDTQAD